MASEASSGEEGEEVGSSEEQLDKRQNREPARVAAGKRSTATSKSTPSPRKQQIDEKRVFELAQEVHSITQSSMEAALKAAKLSFEQEGHLDVARAINLYYEQGMDKIEEESESDSSRERSKTPAKRSKLQGQGANAAGSDTDAAERDGSSAVRVEAKAAMGLLPTTTVPEWGLGQPPEGGPHHATFKQKLTQFERYKNQTANKTTVTFKSCILEELRPALEGKCEMPEHVWNEVCTEVEAQRAMAKAEKRGETDLTKYLSGWTDQEVINKIKEMLKPPRVEDYEIQFEGKKLKHTGAQSELGGKFETWAADWLALEREMKSQGVEIAPARMKKHFEQAVRWHPAIERIIKGTTFTSCKQWYGKIAKELQVQASYASQMERDLRGGRGERNSTPFQSSQGQGGRGRGAGSHVNHQSQGYNQSSSGRKFQDRRADAQQGAHSPGGAPAGRGAGGGAARSNHMEGNHDSWAQGNKMEAMEWRREDHRASGGRGGRGGRGRGNSAPPFGRNPASSPPGRGDRGGAAKGEQFGTRLPINDSKNESPHVLTKGPYWHENGDLLRCSSAICGQPFDTTVFCQGCGWKGHSREWCYKSKEQGFNPTGYWSINRQGQPPLPGKNGEFRGARGNLMDANSDSRKENADAKYTA